MKDRVALPPPPKNECGSDGKAVMANLPASAPVRVKLQAPDTPPVKLTV